MPAILWDNIWFYGKANFMVQLSGTAEVSHRDRAHKQHCTGDCDAGLSQSGDRVDSSLNMGGGFHSSIHLVHLHQNYSWQLSPPVFDHFQ